MYRIHQIKLYMEEDLAVIPHKIKKRLEDPDIEIISWEIVKESIDARDKGKILRVYSVDFEAEGKNIDSLGLAEAPERGYIYPDRGNVELAHQPVIVGFGPCGMFAALVLSEMGYRPIVLERGKKTEERASDVEKFWNEGVLNEESNVQFGEGGAGTFSDGKLTTQIKDKRVEKVIYELIEAGADNSIKYKQKPHIGTDVLRAVVTNIRKKIETNGGEIRFNSKLTGISFGQEGDLHSIMINDCEEIETQQLILAIGHSARDTLEMLFNSGLELIQKPFSIGVRIEHSQNMINTAQLGKSWKELNLHAADYKLSYKCKNGRGVYTFCMCPGGHVIASSSTKGTVVTNGMSYNNRDGANANSGLLVDVRTEDFESDHPLAGIKFQEKYEKLAYEVAGSTFAAPAQRVKEFLKGSSTGRGDRNGVIDPTYKPGVVWTEIKDCLPDFVTEALKEAIPGLAKKLRGFDDPNAILTGIETRSSSPVRILRNECFVSNKTGIYPGGEGAGYAGGIVSAAVDGIKLAETIVRQFAALGNSKD